MFHVQGVTKNGCNLLAVYSGKYVDCRERYEVVPGTVNCPVYPFPELVSSGRLEVQAIMNPSIVELRQAVEASQPNFVYVQGELVEGSEEVGPLVLGDTEVSSAEAFCDVFGSVLPTTVYLEIPDGEKLADALYSKGVRYVIYWNNAVSHYAACHFRQALFSVVQSSCSHTWDAFRLAQASFRLYCVRNNYVSPSNIENEGGKLGPCLIGDPPAIDIILPTTEPEEDEEEGSRDTLPAIKIYDEDVNTRFLICGEPCTLDACLFGALEDGLNALLSIEMRGCKLHNRASAPPPPLQAAAFSRNVVTMKCDLSTSTSAHISLLVSGSAQTCFDDELLENQIKHEVIEKNQIVQALPSGEESRIPLSEPRRSAAIACGASVFEVFFKIPAWAAQVLRQLAPDVSYRSFVALGIASIQGLSVASFEIEDTERLLFFCKKHDERHQNNSLPTGPPSWFVPPLPSRKRHESCQESNPLISNGQNGDNGSMFRQKLNIAAMRPIPHVRRHKPLPFPTIVETDRFEVDQSRRHFSAPPAKQSIMGPPPVTQRKSVSSSYQVQQIIALNPLPLKKHGCGRSPIYSCSEEEFLRDVMQFLMHRGHNRLIPQGGLAEFPDAILNAKRLDLYNLYREVVSRGGFHVGNGINWKGQVFSKMRNHTLTNRMTGVGNTLKRHYETYLLEYELAHDDVDGECCLLCHSSAAGDWVNCGSCGEWAHFGCDRRQGLGAFKDYAKTDGLEYICPHCSVTSFRKKSQKLTNGGLTF